MNDLYLIGNGFDLAHGLKTSYNDFLLWYLKTSVSTTNPGNNFDDELISFSRRYNNPIQDHISVFELKAQLKELSIAINCKHRFFEDLVENYHRNKWVDIEYEYYATLVKIYRDIEKDGELRRDFHIERVKPLNDCFESIKKKLIEYLMRIEISSKHENRQIESILLEGTGAEGKEQGEKLFVNFNYTKTLDLYTNRNFPLKNNLVNIHGELINTSNPIIFGYGDEIDPHYERIENLNRNEFLKYIKSFCYYNTSNYQDTIRFIDSGDYTVKILGHSCGLSDRILLNTIFEHPNCNAIKIYYFKKSETENDFREKTQEISRHFKGLGKAEMRVKIVPLEKSIPLPQNPKDR
jgi:hypothetical protein